MYRVNVGRSPYIWTWIYSHGGGTTDLQWLWVPQDPVPKKEPKPRMYDD